MIPVSHFLILGAILFAIGLVIAISRRNAIMILIGIELMLNATNINFVAFSNQYGNDTNGQFFAVFVMVIAACEAAVALAIILKIYQHFKTSDLDQVDHLRD
jgi:NADH:ubiquinone oxidoreductase subunit K